VNYKNIPNILTILRMFLVIPCAYAFLNDYNVVAVSIFMLAAFTDFIDGLLARKMAWHSQLGAVLDPLADKLLIVVLFTVLTIKGAIPSWFTWIVIVREGILLSGAAYYRFMFGPVIFVPTMVSKINTSLLLFLLLLSLLKSMGIFDASPYMTFLLMAILTTSIYSAVDYIYKWILRVYKTLQVS
jgi:cardiolipin synthase